MYLSQAGVPTMVKRVIMKLTAYFSIGDAVMYVNSNVNCANANASKNTLNVQIVNYIRNILACGSRLVHLSPRLLLVQITRRC